MTTKASNGQNAGKILKNEMAIKTLIPDFLPEFPEEMNKEYYSQVC